MIHYFYGTLQVGIGQTLCSFEHVSCCSYFSLSFYGQLSEQLQCCLTVRPCCLFSVVVFTGYSVAKYDDDDDDSRSTDASYASFMVNGYRKSQTIEQRSVSEEHSWRYADDIHWGT